MPGARIVTSDSSRELAGMAFGAVFASSWWAAAWWGNGMAALLWFIPAILTILFFVGIIEAAYPDK